MDSSRKWFLAGLGGLVLVGCGGTGGGILGQQTPRVRLFDAVTGETTIYATYQDANLNNLGVSSHVSYGAATTDTLVSNTNITATIDAPTGALVTSPSVLLREGDDYTVYAFGTAFPGYHATVLQDSQTVSGSGSSFGVRAFNLGQKAADVDVFVLPMSTALTTSNQVFTSLGSGLVTTSSNTAQAVDGNGYTLDPINGDTVYTVTVTAHGSLTPLAQTSVTVNQGSYYTVAIYDAPTGSSGQTTVAVLNDTRTN